MANRALHSAVVILVEKSFGLHRQMHPVLKRRVAARGEQSGVVGDRFEQCLDPGTIVLGEVGQHMPMHNILQTGMTRSQPVAGVTDADPHPLIIVTDMR